MYATCIDAGISCEAPVDCFHVYWQTHTCTRSRNIGSTCKPAVLKIPSTNSLGKRASSGIPPCCIMMLPFLQTECHQQTCHNLVLRSLPSSNTTTHTSTLTCKHVQMLALTLSTCLPILPHSTRTSGLILNPVSPVTYRARAAATSSQPRGSAPQPQSRPRGSLSRCHPCNPAVQGASSHRMATMGLPDTREIPMQGG